MIKIVHFINLERHWRRTIRAFLILELRVDALVQAHADGVLAVNNIIEGRFEVALFSHGFDDVTPALLLSPQTNRPEVLNVFFVEEHHRHPAGSSESLVKVSSDDDSLDDHAAWVDGLDRSRASEYHLSIAFNEIRTRT